MMRAGSLLMGLLAARTSAPTALSASAGASLLASLWILGAHPRLRRME
jgi:hypothetical protein